MRHAITINSSACSVETNKAALKTKKLTFATTVEGNWTVIGLLCDPQCPQNNWRMTISDFSGAVRSCEAMQSREDLSWRHWDAQEDAGFPKRLPDFHWDYALHFCVALILQFRLAGAQKPWEAETSCIFIRWRVKVTWRFFEECGRLIPRTSPGCKFWSACAISQCWKSTMSNCRMRHSPRNRGAFEAPTFVHFGIVFRDWQSIQILVSMDSLQRHFFRRVCSADSCDAWMRIPHASFVIQQTWHSPTEFSSIHRTVSWN